MRVATLSLPQRSCGTSVQPNVVLSSIKPTLVDVVDHMLHPHLHKSLESALEKEWNWWSRGQLPVSPARTERKSKAEPGGKDRGYIPRTRPRYPMWGYC